MSNVKKCKCEKHSCQVIINKISNMGFILQNFNESPKVELYKNINTKKITNSNRNSLDHNVLNLNNRTPLKNLQGHLMACESHFDEKNVLFLKPKENNILFSGFSINQKLSSEDAKAFVNFKKNCNLHPDSKFHLYNNKFPESILNYGSKENCSSLSAYNSPKEPVNVINSKSVSKFYDANILQSKLSVSNMKISKLFPFQFSPRGSPQKNSINKIVATSDKLSHRKSEKSQLM